MDGTEIELKGKKVLVVGLGKSGLAAALFLRRRGAQVTVSDLRSAQALSKGNSRTDGSRHRGRSRRPWNADFPPSGPDRRQPGVPLIRRNGAGTTSACPIIGELELAARFLQGKDPRHHRLQWENNHHHTCGEIFEAAGLKRGSAAILALPVIELVDESTAGAWSVLEVSSFQLETTELFIRGSP